MAYTYKYPRPAVTADCIVITKEATVGFATSGIWPLWHYARCRQVFNRHKE